MKTLGSESENRSSFWLHFCCTPKKQTIYSLKNKTRMGEPLLSSF